MSEYYLTNDCDAYCGITITSIMDDEIKEEYIDVEYDINGIDIWETNWENLGNMLKTLQGWEEEALYVINNAKGINWKINIGSLHYTDKDVYLGCYGNDGHTVDLGRLGECYDDCETCDKCHNSDGYWDDEYDCYVSASCRECEGCHEHPCIKVNGRKALEDAIAAQKVI